MPYWFTESNRHVIELGVHIARAWQAQLTILHIIEVPSYPEFDKKISGEFEMNLRSHVDSLLDEEIKSWDVDQIQINKKILHGQVVPTLIDLSRSGEYGLIVMGSDQSSIPNSMVIDSKVESIIRYAQIPVLTIRRPFNTLDLQDIVFATDLMATPVYVMQNLSKLQNAFKARLHVVKVNTKEDWITSPEAQSQMEYFTKAHHPSNFEFCTYDDVSPQQGIINYARNLDAGMIALGVQNFSDQKNLIDHHRITEYVLHQSNQLLWTCTL